MSLSKNSITKNQIPRLNSNRYLMPDIQNELTVIQTNNINNKAPAEKVDDKNVKNSSKKKLIIFLLIFSSLILISFIILIIGYICFDWFKKSRS